MLEFKSISIKNFGPFKGEQTLKLSDEPGVSIIYGQNGRGKTTLLNAVRYVLYGYFITRGSKELEFQKVINTDALEIGDYEFSVTLHFTYDEYEYELSRIAKPKNDEKKPELHSDYIQEAFLKKNGIIIPKDETDQILDQIMPEQVSRFFLFDGELLQEYEELVAKESDEGRKIKESIERILGLPLLTNSRNIMQTLKQEAQRQEAKTAQANKSTAEIGVLLDNKTVERLEQEKELERLNKEYKNLKKLKVQQEEDLKKNKNALNLLEEKEQHEISIKNEIQKQERKREKIQESMLNSWQWILNTKLEKLINESEEEYNYLRKKEAEETISNEIKKSLEKAIGKGICPTCNQDIEAKIIGELKEKIKSLEKGITEDEQNRMKLLTTLRSQVQDLRTETKADLVRELIEDINDIQIEINDRKERIREIKEQVIGIDEEKVRKISIELQETEAELVILKKGIQDQEHAVEIVNKDIDKLSERLKNLGDKDIQKDKYRTELYDKLYNIFSKGIDVYRDQLKFKIQEDASNIFNSLKTEPDYTGLSINENYGLTIVRKDGNHVLVRSAGIEHIVALSLMGALQKNAPFRGPIIMDSPFGRLDDEHAPNVVKTLPIMAKQVVLLVFKKELSPELAREKLETNLISEYTLERISSSHTQIEKM